MPRWPHDDPESLKSFYGDPATGAPGQCLVPVVPPFQMYYDGQPVKHIMFHKKAAAALLAALTAIWEHYGRDQKKIDALGISKYSGAYNHRLIRGSSTRWSNHAYGAAIDLDSEHNGFNTGHGTLPQAVVDAFKSQGALWGGDYHGRTDPMHFEFCSRGEAPVVAPPKPAPAPAPKPPVKAPAKPAPAPVLPKPRPQPAPAPAPQPEPVPEPEPQEEAPVPQTTGGGFFSRVRNWIVAGASSVGLGGLGFLTDWQIAAAFFAFLFVSVVCVVAFVILFFGADTVREWVKRHVA